MRVEDIAQVTLQLVELQQQYCCERLNAYLMTIGRRSGLTTLGRTWQFHVTGLHTTAKNSLTDY